MIALPQHTRVYLALGSTDMRKQINGLSILVEATLSLNPFSGHLFAFSNRREVRPPIGPLLVAWRARRCAACHQLCRRLQPALALACDSTSARRGRPKACPRVRLARSTRHDCRAPRPRSRTKDRAVEK